MKKLMFVVALGLACASAPMMLMAQDNGKLSRRVDRLVDRLRSNSQELRRAAQEDLEDLGEDAKELLRSHRDSAKKNGDSDLLERLNKIIGPEKKAKPAPAKEKAEPQGRPWDKLKERARPAEKVRSSYSLSLWLNGKSTTFERDAEGKFKVTEREGKGEAKVQDFADEEAFKKGAPELYETFKSVAPNWGTPAPRSLPKAAPKKSKPDDMFGELFKVLEGTMPEDMREQMRKTREQMEKFRRGEGDPLRDMQKRMDEMFKDFGGLPKSPDGEPFRDFDDVKKHLDDIFKGFGGGGLFKKGDGGKLPKDDSKDEDEEEHY